MLFDYDKDSPDSDIINKSKELLALAGQSQEAPSSLLVTDNVACFPSKWETDLKSEIPDIDALVDKARKDLGLSNDTGKPLIARYIARKLVSESPPAVPLSLKKIIKRQLKSHGERAAYKSQPHPWLLLLAWQGANRHSG